MNRIHSALVLLVAVCVPGGARPVAAQGPSFDAVSVKVNRSGERNGRFTGNVGGITVTNNTLTDIVRNVWNVNRLQIVGGPSWINDDRFDIVAKPPANSTREEITAMLKTMLAERFNLVVHMEMRPMPVYALVLARPDGKLGPTIRPSLAKCEPVLPGPGVTRPPPPPPLDGVTLPACGTNTGPGILRAAGIELSAFTRNMAGGAGRLIIDKTGLTGTFDMVLKFNPDPNDTTSDQPSLFTAMQEQLGLKLDAQTAPAEVLVIDRVEKPTEN